MREWRGRTHVVTVTEDGFIYAGKSYPSLTSIAQEITGAHWSGPRFFEVVRRTAETRDNAEETAEHHHAAAEVCHGEA